MRPRFYSGDPDEWKPFLFIAFAIAAMFLIFGIFVAFAAGAI